MAQAPVTAYERTTTHSAEPMARFSHRARVATALRLVERHLPPGGAMLDFGCAGGQLLRQLRAVRPDARLFGLDPFQQQGEGYTHLRTTADCANQSFDLITAFEVLEHLREPETDGFFRLICEHLTPGGACIVSVPNMLGPVLIPKVLHGQIARDRSWSYSLGETVKGAFLLKSPPRLKPNKSGTMRHKGYDWRTTRERIARDFAIGEQHLAPFPWAWWGFNSQWFCVFRNAGGGSAA